MRSRNYRWIVSSINPDGTLHRINSFPTRKDAMTVAESLARQKANDHAVTDEESRQPQINYPAPQGTAPKTQRVIFTNQEIHVLLRAIASHNDHPDTSDLDRQAGSWLADRFLRVLEGTAV